MKRRRARIVSLPVLIGTAMGVVLAGIGMVWVRSELQRQRYALADLQDRIQATHDAIESLGVERGALASPSRVERIALSIGMVYPPADSVVFVEPERDAVREERAGVPGGASRRAVAATVDLGPPPTTRGARSGSGMGDAR